MGVMKQTLNDLFAEGYTQKHESEMYQSTNPSFIENLCFKNYDHENKNFILEDGVSRAAVLTFKPMSTEGATPRRLVQLREAIEKAYKVFEKKTLAQGQWVVQEFNYNDNRINPIIENMRRHMAPHAQGTQLSNFYLRLQEHHLKGLSQDGGIFKDREVTNENWGFRAPRTKMVIYRRVSKKDISDMKKDRYCPNQELDELIENIQVKLQPIKVETERDTKEDALYWLYKFLNPNPDVDGDKEDHYQRMANVEDEQLLGCDLRELMLSNKPRSDTKRNCWWLDDKPMRFLRFDGLGDAPRIGQITGEVITGDGANASVSCAMDSIPDGCMVSKTVVFTHNEEFEAATDKLRRKCEKNQSPQGRRAEKLLDRIDKEIPIKQPKVRCSFGIYIMGDSVKDLDSKQRKVMSTFQDNNINLLSDTDDGYSLDAFLEHLPMTFDPVKDKGRFLRYMLCQHAANLSFMFGRTEGSGNPNLFYFNRGGAPVLHDPLDRFERANNAFSIILGPPGSGKSVKINTMTLAMMAMYRPRMFIVEYGNSFGLLGDFLSEQGLSVNKIKLDPQNAPSLAPFADIGLVLDDTTPEAMKIAVDKLIDNKAIANDETFLPENPDFKVKESKEYQPDNPEDIAILWNSVSENEKAKDLDDSINENRNVLAELELIALLMITGGEEKEYDRYSRADKFLLKEAIIRTALKVTARGNPEETITQDIIDTIEEMFDGKFEDTNYTESQKSKLRDMSDNLKRYTIGFDGKLFNRKGKAWPDADVTIVDLAALSAEGMQDKLAIAYISLMQRVNNIAEATQHDPRQTVMFTDECHLITSNPLLGPFLVKMVKCFRKLGCWPQFATQNIGDLGGGNAKLLNMVEWFFCLNSPPDEAESIQIVKGLSDEERELLESTTAQRQCYTEGVIISAKYKTLFRSVPPSLILALAMTEPEEKAERKEIMDRTGCTEVQAALEVARQLDMKRGFEHEFGIAA